MSEVLTLGASDEEGRVILLAPDATCRSARGSIRRPAAQQPMTFMRRSSAFIANARVSAMVAPNSVTRRRRPSTHFGFSTPSATGATSVSVRWIAVAVARVARAMSRRKRAPKATWRCSSRATLVKPSTKPGSVPYRSLKSMMKCWPVSASIPSITMW